MPNVIDPDVDERDLEFMDPFDRLRALGLDEDTIQPEEAISPAGNYVIPVPKQKPVPGVIEVQLAQVARSRGLVHQSGQHKGKIQVARICKGTDLAYTTVMGLVDKPAENGYIYMDTLARLCDFLRCTPGDLMRYKPHLAQRAVLSNTYKGRGTP